MAVAKGVDVRRNRARLIETTRRVFVGEGADVSVREIAAEGAHRVIEVTSSEAPSCGGVSSA